MGVAAAPVVGMSSENSGENLERASREDKSVSYRDCLFESLILSV